MAVRTRIDPIDRDIAAIIATDLSPDAQSRAFTAFAREQLAEAQAQNARVLGQAPDHDTFVDGRQGAALETVRPDGEIVFEFHILVDLFEWIDAQLVLNAPVRSGAFARSFVFYADGVEAEPTSPPADATEFVFLNTQPYSRKIERGQSKQAPDGIFQAVAVLATRRFDNMASIWFSYRSPLASYAAVRSARQNRRAAMSAERSTRTPAIIIRM